MTRIGVGSATPRQPSIDNPEARATTGASRAGGAGDGEGIRERTPAGDLGPDRPAPPAGIGTRQATTNLGVFFADLKQWEGEKSFMYVDTRGHVTTGIGHLMKNARSAAELPWYHGATGRPATRAEVKATFEHLRQVWADHKEQNPNGNGISADNYAKKSDLRLPDGYAVDLAMGRLREEFLPRLRKLFPGFDGYPLPAQRALVDMAYNLGTGKLGKKFPRLVEACRCGDFATAAEESRRTSSRQTRNDATKDLFLEAARLNASVQTLNREVRL